jgi:hypothetical protein
MDERAERAEWLATTSIDKHAVPSGDFVLILNHANSPYTIVN